MRITEKIAEFVIGFPHHQSVPHDELFTVLSLSLQDWFAVGIAGIAEPVSTIVRKQALADGGMEQCSVFGTTQKLPPRAAALVNGTTSHALDYDDTHFMHVGHTSVVVFSAALAIAEARGASGKEFMDAALVGSEVCCHTGHWLGRSHYQAGFYQTATAGTFGATATACRLLKLNHLQTRHALGLAATKASGLTSQFGTMSKPYHAGMAAANGVEAALLAAGGFTARLDGLECSRGFAETHHVEAHNTTEPITELGKKYVFNSVQHKLHACCHGLHASIEALQMLKQTYDLNASDIESIVIETNPRWLKVCDIARPVTALESKFSYRHSCALVFSNYDSAALTTYSNECCHDTSLEEIRQLTDVVADASLSDTVSRVRINTKDGKRLEARHDLAEIQPIPQRQKKILAKSCVLIGEDKAMHCWAQIQELASKSSAEMAKLYSLMS